MRRELKKRGVRNPETVSLHGQLPEMIVDFSLQLLLPPHDCIHRMEAQRFLPLYAH